MRTKSNVSLKSVVNLGLKVIALTIILFISFSFASSVVSVSGQARPAATSAQAAAAKALLMVCFLYAAVWTYPILRSRWGGWKLAATVSLVFYGVMTVISQIESAFFLPQMLPPGTLPRLFLMGAIIAGLFAPLAVLILGKMRQPIKHQAPSLRLVMPRSEWAWKLAVIVMSYLILYFTFGYFVAWKNPSLRQYYGGVDPGGFFAQIGTVLRDTPSLIPFQVFRALLWTAWALPVIQMMKGRWWEAGLGIALLFAVLFSAQLLLPNPYMPESVRMSHLVETASSNFIFGWIIFWLLHRHHSSVGDLFGFPKGTTRKDEPA